MSSKHYKWQHKWTADRATQTVTHESGLVFSPAGALLIDRTAPEAWQEFQRHHGPHNVPARIERMSREAAAVYASPDPRNARL